MKLLILLTLAFIIQNYNMSSEIPIINGKSVIKESVLIKDTDIKKEDNRLQSLVYECLEGI